MNRQKRVETPKLDSNTVQFLPDEPPIRLAWARQRLRTVKNGESGVDPLSRLS
ncbi:hypothetical protein JJD41_03970 [Oxynema sp. CENA135]|nr:hypothetical protein [Oxynema sp. CENA135]